MTWAGRLYLLPKPLMLCPQDSEASTAQAQGATGHLDVCCLRSFDVVEQGKREKNKEKWELEEDPQRFLE